MASIEGKLEIAVRAAPLTLRISTRCDDVWIIRGASEPPEVQEVPKETGVPQGRLEPKLMDCKTL